LQDDQYFWVHELEEQKAPSGIFLMSLEGTFLLGIFLPGRVSIF
jgi:hypothetical protein